MGQGKCTGEMTNTHKISVGNPERNKQFWRSRPRWNVKDNVVNWT